MQATEEGYMGKVAKCQVLQIGTNFETKLHPQEKQSQASLAVRKWTESMSKKSARKTEKGLREVQEKRLEKRKGTERSPRQIELCDILQLCAGGEAGGHHTEVSFPEQQKIDLNFLNN